jgi:hypothetical protein
MTDNAATDLTAQRFYLELRALEDDIAKALPPESWDNIYGEADQDCKRDWRADRSCWGQVRIMAANIAAGLVRMDPARSETPRLVALKALDIAWELFYRINQFDPYRPDEFAATKIKGR